MKALLIIFISLMTFNIAHGSCLACWELRKVEITYNNGAVKTGYVEWNEGWISPTLNYEKWHNKFPESFVQFYNTFQPTYDVYLYTKIYPVKNDSIGEFMATTKENIIKIDFKQIKSIREIEKKAENYWGADEMPVFTLEEIEKLRTNPVALIVIQDSISDTYFLSYNPAITRKQLNAVNENNYEQKAVELKKKGVIVYTIGFD